MGNRNLRGCPPPAFDLREAETVAFSIDFNFEAGAIFFTSLLSNFSDLEAEVF